MKVIDQALLTELTAKAQASPRGRSHYNLHQSLDADIHRLLMAAELNSYVRPHRHMQDDKWELLVILKGAISVLILSEEGKVTGRYDLTPGGEVTALEIPAGAFHCFVVRQPGSALIEVKRGPYQPMQESDFAPWAPAEGDAAAAAFLAWQREAKEGDMAPAVK